MEEKKMKKNINGKMSDMELDMVAGGVGFCYYVKDGDKYNYVIANRALSRDEVIQAWNSNGLDMLALIKTDADGNVVSQSLTVSCGRLKAEYVNEFVRRNNERFGGCNYIEFK